MVGLLAPAAPALAGPPLVCHPFEVETPAVLPWGTGSGWNTPSGSYDSRNLVSDTLRLLTPKAPVLARMENMRRATIYAMQNPEVAHRLLKAMMDRALTPSGTRDAQAWFDAGYLIETYRQADFLRRPATGARWAAVEETLTSVDGYSWVKKAFALQAPTADPSVSSASSVAEMEFAASLMTQGGVAAAHRERAARAAARGSLLDRNLRNLENFR
jgi:hypothetical protein